MGMDNAMRVQDLNLGKYLKRYQRSPQDLVASLTHVLHDMPLRLRLKKISQEMQKTPGASKAAELIDTL